MNRSLSRIVCRGLLILVSLAILVACVIVWLMVSPSGDGRGGVVGKSDRDWDDTVQEQAVASSAASPPNVSLIGKSLARSYARTEDDGTVVHVKVLPDGTIRGGRRNPRICDWEGENEDEDDDEDEPSSDPISPRIYEYAEKLTTAELLEKIWMRAKRDEWPSEDTAVALWALALQLKRNTKVLEAIKTALLRPDIPEGAAYNLLGILAYCPKEEVTNFLFDLATSRQLPLYRLWVMEALLTCGSPSHEDIESYMRRVLDRGGVERKTMGFFFSPASPPPDTFLIPDRIAYTVLSYFDEAFSVHNESLLRSNQLGLLCSLLTNESQFRQREHPRDEPYYSPPWCAEVLLRLRNIYHNKEATADTRLAALRYLAIHNAVEDRRLMLHALQHDPDEYVRKSLATYGVASYPPELQQEAENVFWKLLRSDPSEEIREQALLALPQTEEVKARILSLARDCYSRGKSQGDWLLRVRGVRLLERLGEYGLSELEKIAETDEDETLRDRARRKVDVVKRLKARRQNQE